MGREVALLQDELAESKGQCRRLAAQVDAFALAPQDDERRLALHEHRFSDWGLTRNLARWLEEWGQPPLSRTLLWQQARGGSRGLPAPAGGERLSHMQRVVEQRLRGQLERDAATWAVRAGASPTCSCSSSPPGTDCLLLTIDCSLL